MSPSGRDDSPRCGEMSLATKGTGVRQAGTAEPRRKERKNKLTTIISLRENYQFALQTFIVSAAKPLIVCQRQ